MTARSILKNFQKNIFDTKPIYNPSNPLSIQNSFRITPFICISGYDRILVTTGFIGDEGQETARTSEVIDLFNPNISCSNLENAPSVRWASVGGVLNGRPLICGGFNPPFSFQDCFYVQGDHNQNISMIQKRSFASSVVMKGVVCEIDQKEFYYSNFFYR